MDPLLWEGDGGLIHAYYHVWADGTWRKPLYEHLFALERAEFDGLMTFGIVGGREKVAEVREAIEQRIKRCAFITAPTGYEQVTLTALWTDAQRFPNDQFLYAHTKGAFHDSEHQDHWRRRMTRLVVLGWRSHQRELRYADDYDVIGCHWLRPGEWPGEVLGPHFMGNFWVARGSYLATLAKPESGERRLAEIWIGSGDPRVLDLSPGWAGTPQQISGNRGLGG